MYCKIYNITSNESDKCDYGEKLTDDHFLKFSQTPLSSTRENLALAKEKAMGMAKHWLTQNISNQTQTVYSRFKLIP